MRVLVCCALVLSLQGCARDDVALGTDNNANGGSSNGNTNTTGGKPKPEPDANNGDMNTSGDNASNGADANGGGGDDGGGASGKCAAASCESPMEGGTIESDVDGTPKTITGMGHAFIKISAQDGQSFANSAGGIRATLSSTGGNYDLYALGGPSDACKDLGISSTLPAGQDDTVAPIWAVNGPAVAVDWTVTFEVRPADGKCDAKWTLELEGNPCEMMGVITVPKECP